MMGSPGLCYGELLTSARSPPLRIPSPPSLYSALKDTLGVLFSDIDCLGHDGHTSRGEADSALMPGVGGELSRCLLGSQCTLGIEPWFFLASSSP